MSKYILLVINDRLFKEELELLLSQLAKESFGDDDSSGLIWDFEADVKKAAARIAKIDYSLIIVDLHVFPDSQTPSHENQRNGLQFLKSLRDEGIPFSAILICPDSDQEVVDFIPYCGKGNTCEILLKKGDWVGHFLEKVEKGLNHRSTAAKKMGIVDIYLLEKDTQGIQKNSYFMVGKGFDFGPRVGPLKSLGDFDKEHLIHQSRSLGNAAGWDRELYFIGGRLLQCFFNDNPKFQIDFGELVFKAGGSENIRIRYIVEENVHPIALEAVLDEKMMHQMLRCPIFRSVDAVCDKAPLYKDLETQRGKINCLIINAGCFGKPDWGNEKFGSREALPHLDMAEAEAVELEAMLTGKRENPEQFKAAVGNVRILSNTEEEDGFYNEVERVLENGTWHVVHFVGHSYYEEQTRKGYVFFPGLNGNPIPVPIEDFAGTLRDADVRLVYLSSCSSADVDFVFRLSKNNIPATLGFRCPIGDDKAREHAIVFYEKLFLGARRLEYAFLETRKELQKRYQATDRVWAVSILTMQEKTGPGEFANRLS